MEAKTTIVKLSPGNSISKVSTFEEAFGDYSNMSSRRKARKLKRIKNKSEVKAAKQEAKAERKEGKQMAKQRARVAKVNKRGAIQQSRQQNKAARKAAKNTDDPSVSDETTMSPDEQSVVQDTSTQQSYDDSGAQQSSDDVQEDNGSMGQPQPEQDQESQSNSFSSQDVQESEDDVYNEGDDLDGGSEDDVTGGDDSSYIDGKPEDKIVSLARKVEWNKELISRLRKQRAEFLSQGKTTEQIDAKINERIARVKELEQGFLSFCGADGDKHHGKRKSKVAQAINQARKERKALHENKKTDDGGSESPVEVNLENPTSNATGPVLISESGKNDYDADEPRIIEIQSSADGVKKSTVDWKHIAIGSGIALALIWGIAKYKPFGIGK